MDALQTATSPSTRTQPGRPDVQPVAPARIRTVSVSARPAAAESPAVMGTRTGTLAALSRDLAAKPRRGVP
jgi:hypothetical protein